MATVAQPHTELLELCGLDASKFEPKEEDFNSASPGRIQSRTKATRALDLVLPRRSTWHEPYEQRLARECKRVVVVPWQANGALRDSRTPTYGHMAPDDTWA